MLTKQTLFHSQYYFLLFTIFFLTPVGHGSAGEASSPALYVDVSPLAVPHTEIVVEGFDSP